jgi:hypothetical protein
MNNPYRRQKDINTAIDSLTKENEELYKKNRKLRQTRIREAIMEVIGFAIVVGFIVATFSTIGSCIDCSTRDRELRQIRTREIEINSLQQKIHQERVQRCRIVQEIIEANNAERRNSNR